MATKGDGIGSFDSLLTDHLGEFGRYQVVNWIVLSCAWIPCAILALEMVFVEEAEPAWVYTEASGLGDGTGNGGANEEYLCSLPREFWRFSNPSANIGSEWELVCGEGYKRGLVGSIFFLGFLFGVIAFGNVADRVGRLPTYRWTLLVTNLAAVAGLLAPTYWLYALARLLMGFFSSGLGLACFVLAQEIVGTGWRTFTGVLTSGYFSAGVMLMALFAYLEREDWRRLCLICSAPGFVQLLSLLWVRESPRWLLLRGREAEGVEVLREIARGNRTSLPESIVVGGGKEGNDDDEEEEQGGGHEGHGAESVGLCTTAPRTIKHRVFVMCVCWFANSLSYYGLSLGAGSLGSNPYVSLCLSGLVELPAYGLCVVTVNRKHELCGRRGSTVYLMLVCAVACFLLAFLPEGEALGTALALLGKLCISGSFAILYLYTAELFPTVVRTSAIGTCSMSTRVGGIVAPLTVTWTGGDMTLPFLLFGSSVLVGGLLTRTLPETLGKPMAERLEDVCNNSIDGGTPASGDERLILDEDQDTLHFQGGFMDPLLQTHPTVLDSPLGGLRSRLRPEWTRSP